MFGSGRLLASADYLMNEMGSLLNLALLQLLCLLKSKQSRFERVRKIVYRSAKSNHDPAPGRESSAAGQDTIEFERLGS
jgi:hypothetical protein